MPLSNAAVKAARPQACAYKLADEQGLFLHVSPTGTKSFRMRYRGAGGREQTLTFGLYPGVSLVDARTRRDAARARIDRGEDPRTASRAPTVTDAARAWHAHRSSGWSMVHAGDVLASLERDVLPAIGARPLDQVTPRIVLELLEEVERRDAIETARRLRQRIEAIFAFARAKEWTTAANPAEVREAMRHVRGAARQPALVDIDALRELMMAVEALAAGPIVKLASRFLALTAVRLAAIRGLRWHELEDLDGDAPLWRVPAARMKLGVARKGDQAYDHLVPIGAAAAAVLREVRAIAGDVAGGALVFPGRNRGEPLGAGTIGDLYVRAGYAGRHVPHGWRASFSTIMNERHPAERAAIDRALAHAPKDMTKVEAAYNRAQHLERRRALMEEWGQLLSGR